MARALVDGSMRAGLVCLVIAALLAACGDDTESGANLSMSSTPPPERDAAFSLWLSATRVPPGPVELVAVLVSRAGTDATFGVATEVDRWDGVDWVPYGRLAMCMDHWHCTAKIQPLDGDFAVPDIGLSATPGHPGPIERFTTEGLTKGWYRIGQRANEGVVARGVLEVAGDASMPAPLSPTDAPSISVTPAVLSAQGGKVTLFPLIPAEGGTQSLSDVQQAVAGLAEVANLERWQDDGWIHMTDVALAVQPENPGLERIAELPPLEQGEYRLVRNGEDRRHTGRLWISDDVS